MLWWEQCIGGSAELYAGGYILRAGVFTHWELCLFHRFTSIGIARFWLFCLVFVWFFLWWGGLFVCVVLVFDWFSPFLHMRCTSASSFPRLSPPSWKAQQWKKKSLPTKNTKVVQNRSWWKGETRSGSHKCLQLTPALTSSSAKNSQDPLQGLATMCKEEHPRLASSSSFC